MTISVNGILLFINIQLFLLTPVESAAACDKSFIKGAPEAEWTYSSNKLKCSATKKIELGSNMYDELECTTANGWVEKGKTQKLKDANADITIQCKVKPAVPKCDATLVTKTGTKAYTYTGGKLDCGSTYQIKMNNKKYKKLECKDATGWTEVGKTAKLADANAAISVECVENTACDASLRTGDPTKYDASKKLTCSDAKKLIQFKNKQYGELECKADKWTESGKTDKLEDSKAEIAIQCVVKPTCQQSQLDNFKTNEMDYTSSVVKCKNNMRLQYDKAGTTKTTEEIKCGSTHWEEKNSGAYTSIGIENWDKIKLVGCVIPPCDPRLVITPVGMTAPTSTGTASTGVTYKCQNSLVLWVGTEKALNGLSCTENGKWKIENTVKGNADTQINAECKKERCTFTDTTPSSMSFVGQELKCQAGEALVVSTKKYVKLKCDEQNNEWMDSTNQIAPADAKLNVACIKYCKLNSNNAQNLPTWDSTTDSYKCNGQKVVNIAEGKWYADVKCSLNSWTLPSSPDSAIPQDLECRQLCQVANFLSSFDLSGNTIKCKSGEKFNVGSSPEEFASLTCDPQTDFHWKDANGDTAFKSIDELNAVCKIPTCEMKDADTKIKRTVGTDGKVVFKCTDKLGATSSMTFNGTNNLVFSNVYCDSQKGWYDVKGKILESSNGNKPELKCDKQVCAIPSFASCSSFNDNRKGKTLEYNCLSRFLDESDNNMIQCGKENQLMKSNGDQWSLIDTDLRCHSDENWYGVNDDAKTTPVLKKENSDRLVCVNKVCNECQKLADLPGETAHTFTAGTKTTCAEAKCASDLWKIKDLNVEKEYAGKITCSSDKGLWTQDDKNELSASIQVACLATVKCEQAAELVSKCEPSWTDCTPITFDTTTNPGTYSCTTGRLYYKKASALNYEEGADSIQCVNTDGTWNVIQGASAVNKLQRGDHIVCAATNPVPTTTTTTPAPIIKACEVCPPVEPLFDCGECSDKKSDIEITEKADFSVCFATSLTIGAQFMTEKLNVVEGKLQCDNMLKIWVSNKTEVGKFAAYIESDEAAPEAQTSMIIGVSVGGSFLIIIIFVVILKVCICKRHAEIEKEDETKRKMMEDKEKRLKKQKPGDNDEILDGVAVDAPSELKL